MTGAEFILILAIFSGPSGATSQAILFPSKDACEAAITEAAKAFAGYPYGICRAICVPRGKP